MKAEENPHRLSEQPLRVTYRLTSENKEEAEARARNICFEQTVELPDELVDNEYIRNNIVGRLECLERTDGKGFRAVISFATETTGSELTQLLNVIFGNSSIKPGIRVEKLELPDSIISNFDGPHFGIKGIREVVKVNDRPLLCTALKPMGFSSTQLADLAYRFALGGIDIIKDDHGLANQPFCPFEERVRMCAAAVQKANHETGNNCIYVANITASPLIAIDRAKYAKKVGAGGLLICPGLTGFDLMRQIADDASIALPILAHPALLGSYVISPESGICHGIILGQIPRISGADATIYPNFGGRFSFTIDECREIVEATEAKIGNIKVIFPCPGGGMNLQRVPEMLEIYQREVIFLIGGGLLSHSPDLVENCKYFRGLVERFRPF